MAVTLEQALTRVTIPLAAGVLKENIIHDAFFTRLMFSPMSGVEHPYTREGTLGSVGWVAANSGTVSEAASTTLKERVIARAMVSDVDIPGMVDASSSGGSERGTQVRLKVRKAGQNIADAAINGGYVDGITVTSRPVGWNGDYVDALVSIGPHQDTTRGGTAFLKYTHTGTFLQYRAPGDTGFGAQAACASDGSYTLYSENTSKWIRLTLDVSDADENGIVELTLTSSTNKADGLNTMIVPGGSQDLVSSAADGDAFGLGKLDGLITRVKAGTMDRAFLMNGTLIEKFKAAYRALGGASPETVSVGNFGQRVLSYDGVPIFRNDNIGSAESKGTATTLSSVYLVSLDPDEGFSAMYVGAGESQLSDLDPMSKSLLGFMIEELPSRPTADAKPIRVKWYGGFKLGSTLAVARARELITAPSP